MTPREQLDMFDLLTGFFRKYVEAHEIPADKHSTIQPDEFLAWFMSPARTEAVSTAVMRGVDVSVNTLERLTDLAQDLPTFKAVTAAVWHQVVLFDRKLPTRELESIQNITLFRWTDGTLLPIQQVVPKEALSEGGFHDGVVGAVLHSQLENIIRMFLCGADIVDWKPGDCVLDRLHGQGIVGATEEGFHVMMGVLLKIEPQLKPEIQMPVHCWARIVQAVFSLGVLPEAKAQMARMVKLALASKAEADKDAKPRGGWDCEP